MNLLNLDSWTLLQHVYNLGSLPSKKIGRISLINDAICIAIQELSDEDQIQVQQHPFLQENTFTSTKEIPIPF